MSKELIIRLMEEVSGKAEHKGWSTKEKLSTKEGVTRLAFVPSRSAPSWQK